MASAAFLALRPKTPAVAAAIASGVEGAGQQSDEQHTFPIPAAFAPHLVEQLDESVDADLHVLLNLDGPLNTLHEAGGVQDPRR